MQQKIFFHAKQNSEPAELAQSRKELFLLLNIFFNT